MISDQNYLNWHQKLQTNKRFRWFWVFAGVYLTGFFYLGTVLFFFPRWRGMALLALIAFLFAKLIICEGVSFFYKKSRPYQRLNFIPPTSPFFLSYIDKKFNSMPSSHAASLVAICAVCLVFWPLLGILGLIATVFNGFARVILGFHHPSDILAGWLVGVFAAWVVISWLAPMLFTH